VLLRTKFVVFVIAIFLLSSFVFAAGDSPELLLAAGRVDDAISTLQSNLNPTPKGAVSYNLLCRAYFTLSQWDQGIPFCQKAIALDPNNGVYHYWMGRIYGEKADGGGIWAGMGLAKKVRAEFETAVHLDPKNVDARTDLAEFYLEAPGIVGGGLDKANQAAHELMPLDPVKAHWVLGRIAEKQKNRTEAESQYRQGITASNGRADAWLFLALFYRHNAQFDKMEEAVQHVNTAPSAIELAEQRNQLVEAAELLVRTNRNTPLAITLLRRYFATGPVELAPAFKAHYLLGTLLEQQGDEAQAADQYQASLSLARSYSLAQQALNRVNSKLARSG
jgi:tetratricopeptide (TPR) repeat protein